MYRYKRILVPLELGDHDIELIRSEVRDIKRISPEFSKWGSVVRVMDKINRPNITGIIPEYGPMRNIWPEPDGRWINELDVRQNRRVESAYQPSGVIYHISELLTEPVQFFFGLSLPARPPLMGVDVKHKTECPGRFKFDYQISGKGLTIGQYDRLGSKRFDQFGNLDNFGVRERLPARNQHGIALSKTQHGLEFHFDHFQRFLAGMVIVLIAIFTGQVAFACRLQPGKAVVGLSPRHPMKSGRD